ncbi:hypothetical protein [Streptomyces mexicanus]|jgi:hypothetical protein|uniref:hypothetical protein n=1 Tax=Streptomyces mexicanus TaxID=178566 RepID=UPI003649FBCB
MDQRETRGPHEPREPDQDAYRRARDEQEPGAHSGAESQARERTVPGTASAREGWTKGGTAQGEALTGVEAQGEEEGVRPSGTPDTPDAGPVRSSRTDRGGAHEEKDRD